MNPRPKDRHEKKGHCKRNNPDQGCEEDFLPVPNGFVIDVDGRDFSDFPFHNIQKQFIGLAQRSETAGKDSAGAGVGRSFAFVQLISICALVVMPHSSE